ncbi:MBL fold metallo-hydrolase [Telmatobacter bradus]|uniref:MBL fold metallo-hydrolase n=1 Tax=Telmatobacter bradus TaxID=474953 RepID=UPI003B43B088
MQGHLTFLGTGTSMGVPTLGCGCAVCTSSDPHDSRLRPSVLLRWQAEERERSVVIDTGPDFREQALRAKIRRLDAVFYTHGHADHILGLDDLRPLSFLFFAESGPIPLYAGSETRAALEKIYDYTFSPNATYPNRAKVELHPLKPGVRVQEVEFLRVPLLHGRMRISGFRFGKVAYLTDISQIPEESFALLEGVETLVISALRHKPHPTHATVEQALAWSRRIGARQTYFTHIAHELGHEATNRSLPEGVQLAYDGLTISVDLGS